MDVRCRNCGEPWDNDSLHDEAAARRSEGKPRATYTEVAADFRRLGCNALDTEYGVQVCSPRNAAHGATLDVIYEFMGDDMDGAASMIEDAEMMGLL